MQNLSKKGNKNWTKTYEQQTFKTFDTNYSKS